MKKVLSLLFVLLITAGFAYSASKYPKYDAELSKIRTVKNAQTSAINNQIKDIAIKIEALETNTTVNAKEKAKLMSDYNAELDRLTARKQQIADKYKSDKARLKQLYKH